MFRFSAVLAVFIVCLLPRPAAAIIPPDLIVSIGAQFAQLFSFIAFVVSGLVMSVLVGFSPYVLWLRERLWYIAGTIILLALITVAGGHYLQLKQNESLYQEHIATLTQQLQPVTHTSVSGGAPELEPVTAVDSLAAIGRQFRSDTLFFYASGTTPLYLELDLNRRQNPNGTFLHYYYLHGQIDGEDIVEYVTFTSSSSNPYPRDFVVSYTRERAADASTRRAYAGEILLADGVFAFETATLVGDFITKDTPDYTRLQSIATATISYQNKTQSVWVLNETLYGEDYATEIFFPGYDTLAATTHQFVLWTADTFYLVDTSEVRSDTPAYPSHTWLLFKDFATNQSQKGFTVELDQSLVGETVVQYDLRLPELAGATITLAPTSQIDPDNLQIRERIFVTGTVRDSGGERPIAGFLHYIDR